MCVGACVGTCVGACVRSFVRSFNHLLVCSVLLVYSFGCYLVLRRLFSEFAVNCVPDKRTTCFGLGGYLKGDVKNAGQTTVLQCDVSCCNSSYCNNHDLNLLPAAVTVFTPTGKMNIWLLVVLGTAHSSSWPHFIIEPWSRPSKGWSGVALSLVFDSVCRLFGWEQITLTQREQ